MGKIKTAYVCQQCGAVSAKWAGRCAECGEWNSVAEASKFGFTTCMIPKSCAGGAVTAWPVGGILDAIRLTLEG